MTAISNINLSKEIALNLSSILNENSKIASQLNYDEIAGLIPFIQDAERIFITGAGRTGLAMKAAAMRLMHLGFTVFVVGETTTPAITKNDLLIAASGSGTTAGIVKAAEKANAAGAKIAIISTTKESPLAVLSHHISVLPAAQKMDRGATISLQYAGSLFEQAVLLFTDAIIQTLWKLSDIRAEELWKRHANME